ncbi:SIR2 family protein [Pedobacter sp. R20-19]|uniref:SIR2 family protein n=1 Tax=Pedobacter sp. R20-19 TaxID=1270196 RepID=UPI0004935E3A|nr:SIR2 family protein [Pedobacter sp. R20-19]
MIDAKKLKQYKYLKFFPIPFLEDLLNGQVIPFIGAGFSLNAVTPKGKAMPDWFTLGKLIATDLGSDYDFSDPVDAISAYEHEFGRAKLIEKVNGLLLTSRVKPGKAHLAFSEVPFRLVGTTNFDFLIEKAYEMTGMFYCRPLIDEEHLAINHNQNDEVALLKLHGDLNHPRRMIISEEDYDRFLITYPLLATFLANILITKTCLFIGYSLSDPDFRQIWQLIKDRLGKLRRHAFVIGIGTTPQLVAKFERRHVKVINLPKTPGKTFDEILQTLFEEMRDFWMRQLPNHNMVTEEGSKIQLSLNEDQNSRLVYFAISRTDISYYKRYIFPIIENLNYVPVTIEDYGPTISNRLAAIITLVERSAFIVVDVSSSENSNEVGIIFNSKRRRNTIIAIINQQYNGLEHVDVELSIEQRAGVRFIIKPKDFIEKPEDFEENFEEGFKMETRGKVSSIKDEPDRLFRKNEYAAAVVSSVTLLEDALRNRYKQDDSHRPALLNELLKNAQQENIITAQEMMYMRDWISIRNRLVHTSERNITKSQSKKIIDQINNIIELMDIL